MDRREFMKLGTSAASTLALNSPLASAAPGTEVKRPKYILFLMTDQHRAKAMGINGDPHALTPTLDALAMSGMVLDHAYCQNPLCVPSRVSFLLGRYSHSTGIWGNTKKTIAASDLKSYTQIMHENGCQAMCFGKLHIHGRTAQDWTGTKEWFKDYATWAHERQPKKLEKHRVRPGKPEWGQPSPYSKEAHEEWHVKERTVKFMRENVGKPWFIQCSMLRPHGPLMPPPEYWDRLEDHTFSLPDHPADDLEDCHPYLQKHFTVASALPPEEQRKELDRIKAYYACLTFVDDMFREVLEEVDKLGIRDETLIVYTSDHGEMMGHHHKWGKMNFFQESVNVPLIVSMPGVIEAGTRSDALVELVDLFPTFMDVLGLETPATAQGRSLLPVLTGRTETHRGVVRSESAYWGWGSAVMQFDGRYKIIYEPKTDSCDMYDLREDPREITNIAGRPEHRERIAAAVASTKAWSAQDVRNSVANKEG